MLFISHIHVQWLYQSLNLSFPHKNHQNTQLALTNTPSIANHWACARDHIKILSLWYMWYKLTIFKHIFHAAIYRWPSATTYPCSYMWTTIQIVSIITCSKLLLNQHHKGANKPWNDCNKAFSYFFFILQSVMH